MGIFDKKYQKVAIVIYDEDGHVINRAKPQVENMHVAHKAGRKIRDKTDHGVDYEIIQL